MNFDEKRNLKTFFNPQKINNNNNTFLSFRNKNILKDFMKISNFPTLKINYEYQKIIYNYFLKINKKNNNNNNIKNNIRNKNLTPSPKNVILTLNYNKNKKINNLF